MNKSISEFDEFETIAAEFLDRIRSGDAPSIEDYVDQYPDLADRINELFPTILAIERSKENPSNPRLNLGVPDIQQLGDLRMIREIGRGGMGIVYEAEQESLNRRVAVKVLPKQFLLSEKNLKRFTREAKTAAKLHHTNIVPVLGVGHHDGYHYYVMQFIDGSGLDLVLKNICEIVGGKTTINDAQTERSINEHGQHAAQVLLQGKLSTVGQHDTKPVSSNASGEMESDRENLVAASSESAVSMDSGISNSLHSGELGHAYFRSIAKIGIQAARALDYAHKQGTLHRDVKPSNLILDTDGTVWVADFGLAKAAGHEAVSMTGDVVGTLQYMAPEQLKGQEEARSDIYGLGITLFELLTLRQANQPEKQRAAARKPIDQIDGVMPLRKIDKNIPKDLDTIVQKATASLADHRYASAAELANDLECFLNDQPIQARRLSLPERAIRWSRRNTAVATLSTLALALVVIIAVVSTVAYARTNTAYEDVNREYQRAQSTLGLSQVILDRMYERFVPERVLVQPLISIESDDESEFILPDQPAISPETAELLEEMLTFFDQIAQLNSDDVEVRLKAAKANRRVGDIRQRLGEYQTALASYEKAINRYQGFEAEVRELNQIQTEIARIHNERGIAFNKLKDPEQAQVEFGAALKILNALDSESLKVSTRFELARTHLLLGKRPEPPAPDEMNRRPHGPEGMRGPLNGPGNGFGGRRPPPPRSENGRGGGRRFGGPPPSRDEDRPDRPGRGYHPTDPLSKEQLEHLNQAVELLKELGKENPGVPEYQVMLAVCFRESSDGFFTDQMNDAIDLLRQVVSDYPDVSDYRYELAETLAMGDVRSFSRDEVAEAQTRLEEALQLCESLDNNIPMFAVSKVHINHKLGTIYVHRHGGINRRPDPQEFDKAEKLLQEAVDIQSKLVGDFPKSPHFIAWRAKVQSTLANMLYDRKKPDDVERAVELLYAAFDDLLESRAANEDSAIFDRSTRRTAEDLIRVLRSLDRHEEAQLVITQIEMMPDPRERERRNR